MFNGQMRDDRRAARSAGANHFGQFLVLAAACAFSLGLSYLLVFAGGRWLDFSIGVEPDYFEVSQDELDRRYEEVPEEIKEMADRLGLTAEAKRILYRYRPEIFASASDEGYLCARDVELADNLLISGCFAVEEEKIFLLEGPGIESTLIHEFLHAVYQENYRLDRERLTDINRLLEGVYTENEEWLEEIISIYEDLHSHNDGEFDALSRYNELHSWVGVAVEDLPEELEEHYARYFKDRRLVIDAYREQRKD